jgi:hypothetical protein
MNRSSFGERAQSLNLEFQDQPNSGEEFLIDIPDQNEAQITEEFTKEKKLAKLRNEIARKKEERKQSVASSTLRGKDFYLRQVSTFLIASLFLSLASQQFFIYVYMHDLVSAYFDHQTSMFNGGMEGNNYCYMNYFVGNFLGYLIAAGCVIHHIQEDEEFGRKVFSLSLILSAMSVFVATKLLPQKNFPLFCLFYIAIPSFLTGKQTFTYQPASGSS